MRFSTTSLHDQLQLEPRTYAFTFDFQFEIEKIDGMTLPPGKIVRLPRFTSNITLLTTLTTDIQSDKPLLINEELEFSSFEEVSLLYIIPSLLLLF